MPHYNSDYFEVGSAVWSTGSMIEMKSVTGTARSSEIARFCGKWRPHYLQVGT